MSIKTATELAAKCKEVAQNHKTLYVLGCFGAPMNERNKDGATVYTPDVVADRVEFLEWGERNERGSAPRQSGMGGFDAAPEGFSAIDEDIPF